MLEKIQELAQKRGVSLKEIERVCGFGNGSIAKWNTSMPRVDNLKKVADYFGVSIDYFLEESK